MKPIRIDTIDGNWLSFDEYKVDKWPMLSITLIAPSGTYIPIACVSWYEWQCAMQTLNSTFGINI